MALGIAQGLPLLPFCWQGETAMAKVVSLHPRSANAYRVTLEFLLPGDSSPTHVTRELPASRRSRRLTLGEPVKILYRPTSPEFVLILSYPGADWLPPVVLLTFGSFFAFVWKRIGAGPR